jgi:hypothetical protein
MKNWNDGGMEGWNTGVHLSTQHSLSADRQTLFQYFNGYV